MRPSRDSPDRSATPEITALPAGARRASEFAPGKTRAPSSVEDSGAASQRRRGEPVCTDLAKGRRRLAHAARPRQACRASGDHGRSRPSPCDPAGPVRWATIADPVSLKQRTRFARHAFRGNVYNGPSQSGNPSLRDEAASSRFMVRVSSAFMSSVRDWLDSLGLGEYADAFESNAVGWETLCELDHELLKEIGVRAVGHRVQILKAIQSRATPAAAPATVETPSPRATAPAPGGGWRRRGAPPAQRAFL